jgi:hypothetical protein
LHVQEGIVIRFRRVVRSFVSLVVVIGSFVVFTVAPARGSCAAPSISVRPSTAAPGDVVDVVGVGWGTDCNDTGGSPSCGRELPLGKPARDIGIWLSGPSEPQPALLGTIDADRDYGFDFRALLFTTLSPGTYTLEAIGGAFRAPFPVTVVER